MKIKKDINFNSLLNLGFSKVYRYKGSLHSGYVKISKGYTYKFYDETENRKNDIIYIDKNTRVVEIVEDDNFSKIELEMQQKIINTLTENNLVE